jgi:hypothetical protein
VSKTVRIAVINFLVSKDEMDLLTGVEETKVRKIRMLPKLVDG